MKRFRIVPQERQVRLLEIKPRLVGKGIADAWLISIRFDDGSSEEVRRFAYGDRSAWQYAEERAVRLGVEVVRT